MAFQAGDVVFPWRAFIGPRSRSYGLTSEATPRPGYDEDELVDVAGHRCDQAVILESLGAITLITTFVDPSSATTPRYIVFNPTMWAATTAYLAGDIVATNAGQLFECSVGGTSGGSAPTASGADGSVTWLELLGPPSPSGARYDPWRNSTIYDVNVWDIDARAYANDIYPEWALQAPLTFDEWLEIGSDPASMADPNLSLLLTNPRYVLPRVTVAHVDLSAPPEDVAALARAIELSGG